MKKFISFVMAAAMVASLVPATAFAATGDVTATAKVVDAWTRTKDAMEAAEGKVDNDMPELQLKVTSADYQQTQGGVPEMKVTITLDNAEFNTEDDALTVADNITVMRDNGNANTGVVNRDTYTYTAAGADGKTDILEKIFEGDTDFLDGYVVVDAAEKVYDNPKAYDDDMLAALKAALDDIEGPTVTKDLKTVVTEWLTTNYAKLSGCQAAADYEWGWYTDGTGKHEGLVLKSTASGGSTVPYFSMDEITAANDGVELKAETQNYATWVAANQTGLSTTSPQDYYDTKLAATVTGGKVLATEAYSQTTDVTNTSDSVEVTIDSVDKDEAVIIIKGYLAKDDIITIDLLSTMTKTSKNATVSVDSKMVTADDLVYVNVTDAGFTASVKKTVAVAEEEVTYLHSNGLKLKETVEDSFYAGQKVTLKLSKGFEFKQTDVTVNGIAAGEKFDGNELTFTLTPAMINADVDGDNLATLTIKGENNDGDATGLKVEATSAKAETVGTITVTAEGLDKVSVEVIEAVDYLVVMSVDEDEDVPVIYNGVNVNNDGITDDSNHETLEITLEETFPGAWSSRQGFNITLPEGVYVTDVEIVDQENFLINGADMTDGDWFNAFWEAYQDGDYTGFEFGKRVFDDVNKDLEDDPATLTFKLTVVADPGFEGDVEVGFEGALVDTQSVVAAKFVAPYTVTAEQNDLKIDSRYTSIPTSIVVKETADGLWDDGDTPAIFALGIEKGLISFEDDATFTVDKDSELGIKDDLVDYWTDNDAAALRFEVTDTSDKAATVTISDMELFMERNIPAGAYALEVVTSMMVDYEQEVLFAGEDAVINNANNGTWTALAFDADNDNDNWVGSVTDYDNTVKESFINVVTAPRDEDGFTTKITVPVGESYIIAGEVKVEIDTPAYINANGYTMLPLRAVAVALGIDNNSVLWDQSTRTATILYGNRVVSMQNGAKVMYINGQAVATKAGVEITNDRTFLSLRDLGTAMNVTDISWDAATRTAYLNAGVTEQA